MSVPELLTNSPGYPLWNGWCREEGCGLSTLHDNTLLSPNTNFGRWQHPSYPHPWKPVGWFPCGLQFLCNISHDMSAGSPLICKTMMTLVRLLTLSSYHSWIHDPVKSDMPGAILPTGLVTAGCNHGLTVAYGVMVDGQAHTDLCICQHYGIFPPVGTHLCHKI